MLFVIGYSSKSMSVIYKVVICNLHRVYRLLKTLLTNSHSQKRIKRTAKKSSMPTIYSQLKKLLFVTSSFKKLI